MVKNSGTIRIMQKAGGYADFSISGGKLYFTCGTMIGENYGHSEDHFTLDIEETKQFIKYAIGREDAALEVIIFYMQNNAFTSSHFEKILEKAGVKKYVREHVNVNGKGTKNYYS